MNTSTIGKALLVVVLAATGYVGVQLMRANLEATQEEERLRAERVRTEAREEALAAERAKPRFEGAIGGVYLMPKEGPVPSEYTSFEDICGPHDKRSRAASWEESGELGQELPVPEGFALIPDDFNTGAVACMSNGTVYVARRTYSAPSGGTVTIGRSLLDYDVADVAVDRPKTAWLYGHDVVIIEPVTDGGEGQDMRAYFPGSSGKAFISAYDMPRRDFLGLVTFVASSIR